MSEQSPREQDSMQEPARIGTADKGAQRAASYGYGSDLLPGDEVHFTDYVKVLYKRRWPALTAFLIVVLSVCLYTFTATPIYEARV